ncbi:DUF4065 domain-containing protein [candidate division KSB1 bacterium]|nr:DUF4065 domain-containing protein [candidate division KSB1 bacterium]
MKKEFDKKIFKEMILYVAERCADKPNFGSTHLNKILHYTDFFWYGHTGESLSGETYLCAKHGQVPKHFEEVRDELVREGFLAMVEKRCVDYVQKRPTVLKKIELTALSQEQREFIDTIIVWLVDHTAGYVSDQVAHEDLAWKYLNPGDEIPYETVFFRRKKNLSAGEIEAAQAFIEAYEEKLKERPLAAV